MDSLLVTLILFGGLVVLLASGMWIAVALGLMGVVGIMFILNLDASRIAYSAFSTSNSHILGSIPLFILMGQLFVHGGIGERMYRSLTILLGRTPGGLLHANVAACAMFATISGSSIATAATIGTVAIQEQTRLGYDRKALAGSLAAGGTLGILIPPSLQMIVYGWMAQVSIGQLFLAGVVPGILLALLFMAYLGARSLFQPQLAPLPEKHSSWGDKLLALVDLWPVVGTMLIVLGGIYLGVTTPTEAGAMGAALGLIMVMAKRRLSWQLLNEVGLDTVRVTSMVMFLLVGSTIFTTVVAYTKVVDRLLAVVLATGLHPFTVFLLLWVFFTFLGCFLDGVSIMVLTLPLVIPVVLALGFDLVWYGVAYTLIVELSQITPPVGINLFVIKGICGESASIADVSIGSAPFVALMFAFLVVLTVFPDMALWLPHVMAGS